MSAANETTCARTDAVLATHLDGAVEATGCEDTGCGAAGCRDTDEQADTGWEFVSNDTLQEHLRDCTTCQRALQRARRLDAILAGTAGHSLAHHAAETGVEMHALADRLLSRAVASDPKTSVAAASPGVDSSSPDSSSLGSSNVGSNGVGSSGAAADTCRRDELSQPWTLVAAAGLIAAGIATWLFLVKPTTEGMRRVTEHAARPAIAKPNTPIANTPVGEPQLAGNESLSLAFARRLHERERELPEQSTLTLEQLAARVADTELPLPIRLAAGNRLVRATRSNAPRSQNAVSELLAVIAGCGDRSAEDIALQDELLEQVRESATLRSRLRKHLFDVAGSRAGHAQDSLLNSKDTIATVIVAARIGTQALDVALRRVMRRHPQLTDAATSALRCGARPEGSANVLLAGWHDQVTLGNQQDTSHWAEFWFRGQPQNTFAELHQRLRISRSASERVRCLLAMGCVHDDSTIDVLLTQLRSPRSAEAHAAACGLATLPHRILLPLLPSAKPARASMLRTALARAGLPAATPWLANLNSQQRCLLQEAPLDRFPEVVAWFRDLPAIAD